MKLSIRYVLFFSVAVIAGVYLHEIGHAVVGWMEGVAVVPTPAKEYVLQSQLGWDNETWIALGGPIGTTVAALAAALYFWRKPRPASEAILFGAFLPLASYSLRFLIVGRGHDDIEWQAAQAALGLRPSGHAIDVFFLCLFITGLAVWFFRLRPLLWSWLRLATMMIVGIVLLIALQVGNNAVFDHHFPLVKIINVPAGLDPR
ncbi:MAG: hypothetical protein WAM91_05210 [Candidatus Acidiferrales bacterium]